MSIGRLKKELILKHGKRPTICYYYYLWNVVDYAGEERVRASFESVKDQVDEVIIGDNRSTDKTKQLAEEYGFKYVSVSKSDNYLFPESKIRNKVISECESNFLLPININVEYPLFLNEFIKLWIRKSNILKECLRLRYRLQNADGSIDRFYGFSSLFYKPFLIKARGYDERTGYGAGSQKYGATLMKEIFKLRTRPFYLQMVHKYHNDIKLPMINKMYPRITRIKRNRNVAVIVESLMKNLKVNFNDGVKKVRNSYW